VHREAIEGATGILRELREMIEPRARADYLRRKARLSVQSIKLSNKAP
jgi:hypothetical protein